VQLSRSLRARGLKFYDICQKHNEPAVALFTGAWIEMSLLTKSFITGNPSRSLRARGLKLMTCQTLQDHENVALFTGAWIEIVTYIYSFTLYVSVALFTGAWIEIA